MNDWIIKSPIPVECDVLNESLQFPSRNIYCVGRNYRDHAKEMGGVGQLQKGDIVEAKLILLHYHSCLKKI